MIGPTPPGTGVTASALAATLSKSRSPTSRTLPLSSSFTGLMPTSTAMTPSLTMLAVDEPPDACGDDEDVGLARVLRQAAGLGREVVAGDDRCPAREPEPQRRLAHVVRAADEDEVEAVVERGRVDARLLDVAVEEVEHAGRGRGRVARLAEREQAGVLRVHCLDVLQRFERRERCSSETWGGSGRRSRIPEMRGSAFSLPTSASASASSTSGASSSDV